MNDQRPKRPGGWALRGVVVAGLGSLALSGTPSLLLAVIAVVAIVAPAPRMGPNAWAAVHGVILAITGVTALLGPPTFAFAILVAWLLAHRTWTGRSGDDLRVALLLATLLLLLGAVSTETILLAPLFCGYAALLPIALLRAELQDTGEAAPRGLEALVGLGAAALTATLFVVLPRLDGGFAAHGQSLGERFPDDVTLGVEGLTSDDGAEVMRLRVTDPAGFPVPGPFHVRGRAFDRFDGTRWGVATPVERAHEATWSLRAEVELSPLGSDVLFGISDLVRIEGIGARAEPGSLFTARFTSRVAKYRAFSRTVPLAAIDTTDVRPWLQLPEVDPRIRPLAWTIAPDEADPAVVARALSDWLEATYTYVETPPTPDGDPVAWFLFDEHAGHCEYFASALVMLLRSRDIPARLATGFYSDELGDDGRVVVRRGNAHAWVEVRTDAGWATLDPTPASSMPAVDVNALGARIDILLAAWYRDAIEYDMNAQFEAYGAIGKRVLFSGDDAQQSPIRAGFVGMIVVVGSLISGLVLLRTVVSRIGAPRRGGGRRDPFARICADARTIVRRKGWALPPELPPAAAAEWLRAHVGDAAAPFERIAELTYRARYGGAPLASEVAPLVAEARECLSALRRIPRPDRARVIAGSEAGTG
jgi:transglutaminase-like putative cysteine protease